MSDDTNIETETEAARARRVQASFAEKMAMHEKMREVLSPSGVQAGRWVYAHGWNDARIQKECAPRLKPGHAKNLRLECFGQLEVSPVREVEGLSTIEGSLSEIRDSLETAIARIAEVEARVVSLEREVRMVRRIVSGKMGENTKPVNTPAIPVQPTFLQEAIKANSGGKE